MPDSAVDLGPLLDPASVAVIGASADVAGHAGRALANLLRTGYPGRLYPVNPKYDELLGLPCHPSVGAIPDDVEAAYLLVPARAVITTLEECAAKGVRTAIVCTSGFAEMGEAGRAAEARMGEIAAATGMRILGPNCIGVLSVADRYVGCPTFNITYDQSPGSVTVLSHSGGTAVTIFNRAQGEGIGIRAVVSLGNEADLDAGTLLDALVDDEQTRVIALFLEQVRDAPRFLRAAAKARTAGKPVILLKGGRSEVGRRAVLGHTGAMAGEHAVFAQLMRQAGVLEVHSIDEMLLACRILTSDRPGGPRIGVVSPSGGECSYVADRAELRGLVLPDPSPTVVASIEARLRFGNPSNPFDLTGQVIGDVDLLDALLADFFADPAFDMILVAVPTWGPYDAERMLPHFVQAARAAGKPAVISAWSARGLTEVGESILRGSGLPAFTSADDAVDALGLLFSYTSLVDAVPEPPTPRVVEPLPVLGADTSEFAVKSALAVRGVPTSTEVMVDGVEAIAAAAEKVSFPLVLKLLAHGVAHKSEHGFVEVGVGDADRAVACASTMVSRARAQGFEVEGLLLAAQESGLEMIVGGVVDDTFGPVVMVGAGGTLAEYFSDVAFVRAPASRDAAQRAIAGLRAHRVLSGARGTRYDTDALADLVVRVSEILAASPHVLELDLNPVIVRPAGAGVGGVVVVDAVIRER